MPSISEKDLRHLEYLSRETGTYHHPISKEEYLTQMLLHNEKALLDQLSLEDDSVHQGHLSNDPVQRVRYLFVAGTTVMTRAAMAAGVDQKRAYNLSDSFIYRMDCLTGADPIKELFRELGAVLMKEVQAVKKHRVYSRAVAKGMEYIEKHLHQPTSVQQVAQFAGLSTSYFAGQFKKETGRSVAVYLVEQRIEAAKDLLRYSELSQAEIGATLAFSSQSHFIHAFKRAVGVTPGQFRRRAELIG